jgi:hypothetical protein
MLIAVAPIRNKCGVNESRSFAIRERVSIFPHFYMATPEVCYFCLSERSLNLKPVRATSLCTRWFLAACCHLFSRLRWGFWSGSTKPCRIYPQKKVYGAQLQDFPQSAEMQAPSGSQSKEYRRTPHSESCVPLGSD